MSNTEIYAHVDENGVLQGWYNTGIFNLEDIPTPRILVSEDQHQIAQEHCHNKVLSDGTTLFEDLRSTEEISKHDQEVVNEQSRAYLANTDWYVIRFQETGEAIPQEILDERAAARDRVI